MLDYGETRQRQFMVFERVSSATIGGTFIGGNSG